MRLIQTWSFVWGGPWRGETGGRGGPPAGGRGRGESTLWFVEHTSGCVGAQSVVLYTGLVGREARSGDHVARLLFARARRSASLSA